MPKNNNKILENRLTKLETVQLEIREDVSSIKRQIFNHLPAMIEALEDSFNEYKLSDSRWKIGILVSIIMLLLAVLFK